MVSGWHGPINDNVTAVQVYDTSESTWHSATPIPDPEPGLFGHAGGAVGDRLIYLDGVTSSSGFRISDRVFMGLEDSLVLVTLGSETGSVAGGGVVVLASMIDNISQDPTTITMQVDRSCR